MRKIIFLVVLFLPISPAFAVTDQELVEKCVLGWKLYVPKGIQYSYSAGGTVQGIKKSVSGTIVINGTWEVKGGVLTQHTNSENGPQITTSFPLHVADDGTCMFTAGGSDHRMDH